MAGGSADGSLTFILQPVETEDRAWQIGPRTVPPPAGASRELHDLLAHMPAPVLDGVPTTISEVKAAARAADNDRLDSAIEFARRERISIMPDRIAGVSVSHVNPPEVAREHANRLFVHIHGGLIVGGGLAGTAEAVRLAAFLKMPLLSIDYRMAPEHPAPAAMDDIIAVWRELIREKAAANLAMGGTSAGGMLTLVAALRMKELRLAFPSCLFVGTPSADLAKRGDMRFINDGIDRTLVSWDRIAYAISLYVGPRSYEDPYVSPIFGDFSGFPPAYLVSGTRDLMLSDTVRTHRKLRQAGVQAELHVYEGVSHADYVAVDGSPEQREHHEELNAFLSRNMGA